MTLGQGCLLPETALARHRAVGGQARCPCISLRQRGLGLGLALVKDLVELHGGSITVRSDGHGQGAEFVIRLPAEALVSNEIDEVVTRPKAERRRILVLDDNVDAAQSLRELLELDEHVVEVAHDGLQALAQARVFRPEIVLCDIGLPGMDGFQVAEAFRADSTLRNALLVAISGYAAPEDLRHARQAGFDRHLAKPASLERLYGLLADLGQEGGGLE
jgi:CheY-like chemotaxis protein